MSINGMSKLYSINLFISKYNLEFSFGKVCKALEEVCNLPNL